MTGRTDQANWEDRVAKRWLAGMTRPSTQRYYKSAFRLFVEYTKRTPTELVEEALEDMKRDPANRQDVVMQRLVGFYKWLKEDYGVKSRGSGKHAIVGRGVSDRVAETYTNVVRSFYNTFGVSVKMKGRRTLPKGRATNKRGKVKVATEQVRLLVDNARTPRDKAIIMTIFQTGIDAGTLCALRYGDVSRTLDGAERPYKLELRSPKTGAEYFTFIGKDAADAISIYVKDCEARGIKLSSDSPLFLTEKGRAPIEAHNVQNMLRDAAIKAGFLRREREGKVERREEGNPRRFNPYGPHALRESFGSIMVNSGVPDSIVAFWQGRQIGEMATAYRGSQEEGLRGMYKERERLLSPFAPLGNDMLSGKIEELDRTTMNLKEGLGHVVERNTELEAQQSALKVELQDQRRALEGQMRALGDRLEQARKAIDGIREALEAMREGGEPAQ
jgi:integrase/regulator of replication initiation timing